MLEVPVHRCIGPTWVDSYQTLEIGLAEGIMKLAEGVTSELWFCAKYIFVEKIYKHDTTPVWGLATETV